MRYLVKLAEWMKKKRKPLWAWVGTGKHNGIDVYLLFEPRDLWVFFFFDYERLWMFDGTWNDGKRYRYHSFRLYICLIPTLPILIKWLYMEPDPDNKPV